ncbi:MAG: biotin--[acetyl-CoA-carboxylase] ligase [Thermoguttaceae bacterium]
MSQVPERSEPIDCNWLVEHTFLASVEHHATLGSTNDRGKGLARDPAAALPVLIVADEQTAGRGRGSRRWWTGPGSLAFSLLVDTQSWNVSRERLVMTALVAGIAVVDAISPRIAGQRVGLHWPNDVYVAERKVAGILLESPAEHRLVIGVGINTNCRFAAAPADVAGRATSLIDLTETVQDHTRLLAEWLQAWLRWSERLRTEPDSVGDRADRMCLQKGQILHLKQGKEACEGRCAGIGPDGAIRLETPQGMREFYSGTVR